MKRKSFNKNGHTHTNYCFVFCIILLNMYDNNNNTWSCVYSSHQSQLLITSPTIYTDYTKTTNHINKSKYYSSSTHVCSKHSTNFKPTLLYKPGQLVKINVYILGFSIIL